MQKWRNEKQKRMQRNVQLNRIKYDYCLKMRWVRKRTVWRGEKEDKQKVNKRDLLETNENRTEEFKNSETKKTCRERTNERKWQHEESQRLNKNSVDIQQMWIHESVCSVLFESVRTTNKINAENDDDCVDRQREDVRQQKKTIKSSEWMKPAGKRA